LSSLPSLLSTTSRNVPVLARLKYPIDIMRRCYQIFCCVSISGARIAFFLHYIQLYTKRATQPDKNYHFALGPGWYPIGFVYLK
jgi:hypothetical protein